MTVQRSKRGKAAPPFYLPDYLAALGDADPLAAYALLQVVGHCARTGASWPGETPELARIARVSPRFWTTRVAPIISELSPVYPGDNSRENGSNALLDMVREDCAKVADISEKRREAAIISHAPTSKRQVHDVSANAGAIAGANADLQTASQHRIETPPDPPCVPDAQQSFELPYMAPARAGAATELKLTGELAPDSTSGRKEERQGSLLPAVGGASASPKPARARGKSPRIKVGMDWVPPEGIRGKVAEFEAQGLDTDRVLGNFVRYQSVKPGLVDPGYAFLGWCQNDLNRGMNMRPRTLASGTRIGEPVISRMTERQRIDRQWMEEYRRMGLVGGGERLDSTDKNSGETPDGNGLVIEGNAQDDK